MSSSFLHETGIQSLIFSTVPFMVATPLLTFVLLVFLFFFLDGLYERGVLFQPPLKRFSLVLGIVLASIAVSVIGMAIYGGVKGARSPFMPRDFPTELRVPETYFMSVILCCSLVFLVYCIAGLVRIGEQRASLQVLNAFRRLLVCASLICVAVVVQLAINILSYRSLTNPPMWAYVILGYLVPETFVLSSLLFYVSQPFLVSGTWRKKSRHSSAQSLLERASEEEIPDAYQ